MSLVNAVSAKPREKNFTFIAGRFVPGPWELGVSFIHFSGTHLNAKFLVGGTFNGENLSDKIILTVFVCEGGFKILEVEGMI